MNMNTCKLQLFTWGYVKGADGKEILSPICPQHPDAHVHVETSGEHDLVVTCPSGQLHPLNMCSRQAFEAEKEEARIHLTKLK